MEKCKEILEHLNWTVDIPKDGFIFGNYKIESYEVFIVTKYCYGFVNNKPLLPGHILVSPLEKRKKYNDLTIEELKDLHFLSNFLCYVLGKLFDAESFTISIQDGKDAGQTVDHVHVHIIPRKNKDYKNNDHIYRDLNRLNVGYGRNMICNSCNNTISVISQIPVEEFKLEEFNTAVRTMAEMEKESVMIRNYITTNFS